MNEKPARFEKSLARLLAVQTLFEVEATRRHYKEVLSEIAAQNKAQLLDLEMDDSEDDGLVKYDRKLVDQIVSDAVYHQVRIDQSVNSVLSEGWPLKAIDPVLRAIFRAAGAEFVRGKAPFKVVINEYLEVTRAFDERKESVSFVNAVLDALHGRLAEK